MQAKLYYESHITIDPVPEWHKQTLQDKVGLFGFKLAKLLMCKEIPSTLDTFMTAHGTDSDDILSRTAECIGALKHMGYKVRRYKIEDTLTDSRYFDELGLLA